MAAQQPDGCIHSRSSSVPLVDSRRVCKIVISKTVKRIGRVSYEVLHGSRSLVFSQEGGGGWGARFKPFAWRRIYTDQSIASRSSIQIGSSHPYSQRSLPRLIRYRLSNSDSLSRAPRVSRYLRPALSDIPPRPRQQILVWQVNFLSQLINLLRSIYMVGYFSNYCHMIF